jgi:3-oxoadipate enol-lactonase
MAEDVRTTLAELEVSTAALAGLSMGGGVAQALTIRHPDLVRALVLVSTSSEFPAATHRRFIERADRAERGGMTEVIDATVPRWFTPAFTEAHPDEVERTRRGVLAIDPGAFAAASRANAVRRFTDDLPSIECPVLFVGGAQDPADPRRAIGLYRQGLRDFRAELIPDASHLVPVEAPAAFNDIVLRFLAEAEPEPRSPGGVS